LRFQAAGLSSPSIWSKRGLTSFAFILAGRFIIRPIVVPIAVRRGLRTVVILGTCLTALQYPLFAEVRSIGRATTPTLPPSAITSIEFGSGRARGDLGAIGIVSPLVTRQHARLLVGEGSEF
jgi:hypothetical protein